MGIKAFASEMLTLLPLLRTFIQDVVVPTGALADECRCFLKLCTISDILCVGDKAAPAACQQPAAASSQQPAASAAPAASNHSSSSCNSSSIGRGGSGSKAVRYADALARIIDKHCEFFIALHPDALRPTFHYMKHIPDQLEQISIASSLNASIASPSLLAGPCSAISKKP